MTCGVVQEVLADWAVVARLRADLPSVPIVCNGDLWHWEDVALCRQITGCVAFMSAQGLLHNPALFQPLVEADQKQQQAAASSASAVSASTTLAPYMRRRRALAATLTFSLSFSWAPKVAHASGASGVHRPSASASSTASSALSTPQDVQRQFALAEQYLALCRSYPPSHPSIIRRHLFFLLFDNFQANVDVFDRLCTAHTDKAYRTVIKALHLRAEQGITKRQAPVANAVLSKDGAVVTKSRPLRRDGTIAPPPWPPGGGGMNENLGEGGAAPDAEDEEQAKQQTAADASSSAAAATASGSAPKPKPKSSSASNGKPKPKPGAAPAKKKPATVIVRSEQEALAATLLAQASARRGLSAAALTAKANTAPIGPAAEALKAKAKANAAAKTKTKTPQPSPSAVKTPQPSPSAVKAKAKANAV